MNKLKMVVSGVLLAVASIAAAHADETIMSLSCVKKVEADQGVDKISTILDLNMLKDANGMGYIVSKHVAKDGETNGFTYYKGGVKGDLIIFTTRKQGDSPSSDADTLLLDLKNRSGDESKPLYAAAIVKTRNEVVKDIQKEDFYFCQPN